MAITVTNLNTLQLLNILNRTTNEQESIITRMSTGYKINKGSDDPAGLLAVTNLNSELTSVDAAITNNQRTDAIMGVAEGALTEVGNLVAEIQRLANEAANEGALSADELAANQSQIDDALASIDRIIGSTQFNGQNLLDGSLGIDTTYDTTMISDVNVYSRKSGASDSTLTMQVTTDAAVASSAGWMTAAATADTTVTIQGKLGTAVLSWSNGETLANIESMIDAAKAQTGVEASVNAASNLALISTETGESSFIRTTVIEGQALTAVDVKGTDAAVSINGQSAAVDGKHVNYSGDGISLSFDLTGMDVAAGAQTLVVKGGSNSGATFSLGTEATSLATVGIDGMYTAQLGNSTDGYLASLASGGSNSLLNDPSGAATIARKAADQIATVRGRIGGFQKFQVRTALTSLGDLKEGLEQARGVIRDVDYAAESADLSRTNVLMQSALSMLGIANQQSASVLSLLR